MKTLNFMPTEFSKLKKPPKQLYFKGKSELLHMPKVSIVGSRRATSYTKNITAILAQKFSDIGYAIVSGAAMGVDAIAHKAAFPNTIAVMANSLDLTYPKVNEKLIKDIYKNSLALSEYEINTPATKYSFVIRNRIVVALGEFLIITQADENSGTMRSAQIAHELGKKIFVIPHRLAESSGTQKLLKEFKAELILDIDEFVARYGTAFESDDELLLFCRDIPSLSDVVEKFGDRVYEYELEGKVEIKNLRVYPL